MSEKDKGAMIADLMKMPEGDQKFLLGVMAGLAAKQNAAQEQSADDPKTP